MATSRKSLLNVFFSKKGALQRLFLFTLFVLTVIIQKNALANYDPYYHLRCKNSSISGEYNEWVSVRYVHDGDTVHLGDGRKVRLIGINTPELAKDNKPAEPYALQAKQALSSLINRNNRIALVYGKDRLDRYGRILAHLFLENGENIQSNLLKAGLASAINIPPNTRFSACYLQDEQQARCIKRGLWQHNGIVPVEKLANHRSGFALVKGRVSKLTRNGKGIWLTIGSELTVGIRPDDQHLFSTELINSYKNQELVVRGWINKSSKKSSISTPYYIRVKHPYSIQLAEETRCD